MRVKLQAFLFRIKSGCCCCIHPPFSNPCISWDFVRAELDPWALNYRETSIGPFFTRELCPRLTHLCFRSGDSPGSNFPMALDLIVRVSPRSELHSIEGMAFNLLYEHHISAIIGSTKWTITGKLSPGRPSLRQVANGGQPIIGSTELTFRFQWLGPVKAERTHTWAQYEFTVRAMSSKSRECVSQGIPWGSGSA